MTKSSKSVFVLLRVLQTDKSIHEKVERRFSEKINRLTKEECWEWLSAKDSRNEYGKFFIFGKSLGAHKISYSLYKGEVPEGLTVLHTCDNPGCVNPNHLFVGTDMDNQQDMLRKNRGNKASGLRSGRYTKPERTARGDQHGSVTKPGRLPRGENQWCSKLTIKKVIEIRRLFVLGWRVAAIARKYQVDWSTIKAIKLGITWKHI